MDPLVQGSAQSMLAACEGLPVESFSAGDTLIAEGPATGRMWVLVSGEVGVYRGETEVADISDPGAVFGEIAALLGGGHSATVRAITPVAAIRIEDGAAFLRSNSDAMFQVGRLLAQRLTSATIYLADIKRQFADRADHLGMVDEVLEALVQRQRPTGAAGSNLQSDPRL